jgi:hypothetical protein
MAWPRSEDMKGNVGAMRGEDLTDCARERWFGVVAATVTAVGDALRGFDCDGSVSIVNSENVVAQGGEPEDTNNLQTVVAAQVRKI